jgi:hypothetical protein
MIQITMFYFLHNPHVVLRKYMQHSKAMLPSVLNSVIGLLLQQENGPRSIVLRKTILTFTVPRSRTVTPMDSIHSVCSTLDTCTKFTVLWDMTPYNLVDTNQCSDLKIEAARSSETMVPLCWTGRYHIPGDRDLNTQRREIFKSYRYQ